ncbi:N-acetyl-1-D-myo-inositol-2-amino-2-deoxy-alpha-D-glucopyranoside deacetylase [Austwickia chelonae]|uniref:N-acetyl-1-D-myo-inositol-2-amino-2-deoxy-alpha- D-glucopyranoside deacetylase n=1 Tax=Austwickia chelonae TaxID=100225 RepID=UPI000E244F8F|nr:N-acetyl-1-D-myo-inositol-2-amino-2-deoxy-alpha-D-glucopyranoside deacetylase [Austwickia chelonae]
MSEQTRRTLLFVHAHPDDETLATGVTLAQRVIDGDDVHVLTCTLGDEGEVIPPDLAHLTADKEGGLEARRRVELRAAMDKLGVIEHVLGESVLGPGRAKYRDSGMAGSPSMEHPRALCRAPLPEVSAAVADHLRALRPQVVVTYDPHGGYSHPDHVRVYEATCAAVTTLPPKERPALWAVVVRRSQASADRAWVAKHTPTDAGLIVPGSREAFPPGVVDDGLVAWDVRGSTEALRRRNEALRCHETQVRVGQGWYALSNDIAARLSDIESFTPLDAGTGAFLARAGLDEDVDPRMAP